MCDHIGNMKKIFCLTLLLFATGTFATESTVVKISGGKVEGYIGTTKNGREFVAFEGVPYAEPPVGNLRFEPPKPKRSWSGTWKANTVHTCLQYAHGHAGSASIKGNEDCLYLNIYKPNNNLTDLDVIVFIHGGAFMFNNGGGFRPIYLLDRNVVLITLNYRLGPLGFLSLNDYLLPGNNGMKDQTLALKWIKSNIRHFGGNPKSITITGMSAGGASVHLHTLSPSSRGLFHKAFAQSGVALNPWVLVENARDKALELGSLLGCPTTSSLELIMCLKSRPGHQIVENVKHFQKWLYNPFTPFGPVIEKHNAHPFLTEHPLTLMKKKQVADVPIIFSFVECEGLYPAADFALDPKFLEDIDTKWNDIIPAVLHYNDAVSANDMNFVNTEVREAYFGNKQVNMDTYDDLVQMVSDRLFIKDISDVALLHSKAINSPVFSYKLSYLGANGLSKLRAPEVQFNCTSHADDTFYVLPSVDFMRTNEEDTKMSEIFLDAWTSLAKSGVPSINNVDWQSITVDDNNLNYLHMKSPENIEMESVDNLGMADLWNSLPINENEHLVD